MSLPIWLHNINPIALSIGPLKIHWYGLMYMLGALAAVYLGKRRARDTWRGFTSSDIDDLVFYSMLGVVIGGRVGYMLIYGRAELIANPLSVFKVWEGGMSFHGGLAGVIVAMMWFGAKRQISKLKLLDMCAAIVPIGLGLGRLGNFIGGELWGRLTHAGWGVIFPKALYEQGLDDAQIQAMYTSGALNDMARHPSQLYQAGCEGIFLFLILWFYSRKQRANGKVGGLFMMLYGLTRFGLEFFREPDAQMGFIALQWLTTGQLLSAIMILIGAVIFFRAKSPISTS
jgi:phosphatidylglycerol---prolipoprotein diacylglyceryl transferase